MSLVRNLKKKKEVCLEVLRKARRNLEATKHTEKTLKNIFKHSICNLLNETL